jgi:hypothetical protein
MRCPDCWTLLHYSNNGWLAAPINSWLAALINPCKRIALIMQTSSVTTVCALLTPLQL